MVVSTVNYIFGKFKMNVRIDVHFGKSINIFIYTQSCVCVSFSCIMINGNTHKKHKS